MKMYRVCERTYCGRIIIEGTRFPPFGLDIVGIIPNSNADIAFYDNEHSVSSLRARYSGNEAYNDEADNDDDDDGVTLFSNVPCNQP